jgi:hypothetical protein
MSSTVIIFPKLVIECRGPVGLQSGFSPVPPPGRCSTGSQGTSLLTVMGQAISIIGWAGVVAWYLGVLLGVKPSTHWVTVVVSLAVTQVGSAFAKRFKQGLIVTNGMPETAQKGVRPPALRQSTQGAPQGGRRPRRLTPV